MRRERCPLHRRWPAVVLCIAAAGSIAFTASPEQAAAAQTCYFPSLTACTNTPAGGPWGPATHPWVSASVFAASAYQSFFNNKTSGTAKRQLLYRRLGPGNYQFWLQKDRDADPPSPLWYYPYTSSSDVMTRCQTLGGGTVTIQCGEVHTGGYFLFPN